MKGTEVLAAAESGDIESVAAYLAGEVDPKDAARVLMSAINGGRIEVVNQIQQWSVARWGEPLLGQDALLDLVDAALHFKGGEDPDLDRRLARLMEALGQESSSVSRDISYSLAGGAAETVEEGEPEDELRAPERGMSFVPRRSDEPLGQPEDGVAYFTRRMFSTFPQWSLLAFRSPAADLAKRLVDLLGTDQWIVDAADRPLPSGEDEYFLLQLKEHDWSLLLTVSLPQVPRILSNQAQKLSKALGLRVIAFSYEETGGSSVAQVFENGRLDKKARNRRSWNKLFRDESLFVPFFGLHSDGGRTELLLEGLDRSHVESLHFFT